MIKKLKNAVKKVSVGILTSLMLINITPIMASASGVSDVNVSVGSDGSLAVEGGGMSNNTDSATAWNEIILKYKNFIAGISGVMTVSMILFFIILFGKLGATVGNPSERSKCIMGLITTGIAAAGLGAVTVIVGFFYSALA